MTASVTDSVADNNERDPRGNPARCQILLVGSAFDVMAVRLTTTGLHNGKIHAMRRLGLACCLVLLACRSRAEEPSKGAPKAAASDVPLVPGDELQIGNFKYQVCGDPLGRSKERPVAEEFKSVPPSDDGENG